MDRIVTSLIPPLNTWKVATGKKTETKILREAKVANVKSIVYAQEEGLSIYPNMYVNICLSNRYVYLEIGHSQKKKQNFYS